MTIDQTMEAKRAAVSLLSIRDYSTEELKQRLNEAGFDEESAAVAIAYAQEKGWQSDEKIAEMLIDRLTQIRPSGDAKIIDEFRSRGLNLPPTERLPSELDRACLALTQKYGDARFDAKALQRWRLFLSGRGFLPDVIDEAIHRWRPGLLDAVDA